MPEIGPREAILALVRERLTSALAGDLSFEAALAELKDLCIADDYTQELYDFYLLHFAYSDLQSSEAQWYWQGATRANMEQIIRDRASRFVESAAGRLKWS